jgi:hypothetical protein
MLKRSDSVGSLIEVSLVEEHFTSEPTTSCSCRHSSSSEVESDGVKKMCRPGDTRDVNGGVEVYGFGDAQRIWNSCHIWIAALNFSGSVFVQAELLMIYKEVYLARQFIEPKCVAMLFRCLYALHEEIDFLAVARDF